MFKKLSVLLLLVLLGGHNEFKDLDTYVYEGVSMTPTIQNEQKIQVDKKYYQDTPVKRGDIVLFEKEGEDFDQHAKRVIGLPNEMLEFKDGTVYIDGEKLSKKYHFNHVEGEAIQLKKNEYFVIGDNALSSKDSRHFGPLQEEEILGKVIIEED
ncbi:signal peptidase I [Oikeobacillus pervagus]|nr:signal peptidase I [Oikeobacillus pervagus]